MIRYGFFDRAVHLGMDRKADSAVYRMVDHRGLITDSINANIRYRYTIRQCRLTALDELQILFVRRFIAFSKLYRHHLAGFTYVTDHRRVVTVLFLRELSATLVRFDHRSVDVQGNLLSLIKRCYQDRFVDIDQSLHRLSTATDALQSIA